VKVALKACSDWADQIDGRRISPTLLADIEGKQKSLGFAISNEVLEQTLRIQKKQDELKKIVEIGIKKPLEYYEDGKHLINEKRWYEAKAEFLKYRALVLQGTPVNQKEGDGGIKPPAVDSHLKYLAYVETQLQLQEWNTILTGAPSSTTAPTPPVKKNDYDTLWEKWQNDHMKKK